MKIAHLLSHAGLNGVATSTYTLIQAQLRAGHEVMLVHPPNSWIGQQVFDRPIPTFTSYLRTEISELRRVGYHVQGWGEDVLHTHGSKANKFGMIYRLIARTPTVMTAHARLFQLPWRFAHSVIAPSRPTAEYYRRRLLVTKASVQIVPHMFDVTTVSLVTEQSRASARATLGIRPEAFLLGSVGEICDRKYQIDMLRILKRLVRLGVDAELVLIGPVIELTEAEQWAKLMADPDVARRVHLTGQRSDALALLHAMDAYLCTSRVEEGPIATFEAMASGIPVVTVDVGYSSAIIRDGENGRVFPMGAVDDMAQACAMLARDQALGAKLGIAGRAAIAEMLTAERIIPQIEEVYRLAIRRSRRKPRKT